MKKILLFFSLFFILFIFNILHVDSDSSKNLFYTDSSYYNIYFVNTTSKELKESLKSVDMLILSYKIDGKKYYVNSIDELISEYCESKSLNEKLYYEENGVLIDSISVISDENEVKRLQNIVKIY